MKRLVLVGLILVLMGGMAVAEEGVASSPDPAGAAYGARPLGMGGAFVSLADDTNAVFTNPAGLASLGDWSITSMSTQLLQKVDYIMAGGTYRIGPGNLGLGYIGTSAPCGYEYDDLGNPVSDTPISYDSNMILLSYGVNMNSMMKTPKGMGDFSIGGTVKALSSGFTGIEGATATGFGLDLGVKIGGDDSTMSYGAVIKNIGGTMSWASGAEEALESSSKLGVTAKLCGENGLTKMVPGELVGSLDLELLSDGKPMVFHVGTEYKPMDMLALRLGLDQDPISESETANNITAGVGIELSGFRFDYAYKMNSESAELSNHYFSLSYSPEITKSEKADSDDEKVAEKKGNKKSSDIYEIPEEYLIY